MWELTQLNSKNELSTRSTRKNSWMAPGKPFSKITLHSMYTFTNFEENEVFAIRQLPSTWKSKTMLELSRLTALVSPTRLRTNIKWVCWSRELMLVACGRNSG